MSASSASALVLTISRTMIAAITASTFTGVVTHAQVPCASRWLPSSPVAGPPQGSRSITLDRNGNVVVASGIWIDGASTSGGVVRWENDAWLPVGHGFYDSVYDIVHIENGDIIAVGPFERVGQHIVNHVARWNGQEWLPMGAGLTGGTNWVSWSVAQLANGDIVAAGDFTHADGVVANSIARWDGVAWHPMGTGLNGRVWTLKLLNNGILVAGGEFTEAGGLHVNRIAQWNGSDWSGLGAGFNGPVYALTVLSNGDIIAGGNFWSGQISNVARWNGLEWSQMGTGLSGGDVRDLCTQPNDHVIAGGFFGTPGIPSTSYIAEWDGISWSPVGPSLNNDVLTVASLPNGDVIAGGNFTRAGQLGCAGFARWDGSSWNCVGPGNGGPIEAIAVSPAGELFVGGLFCSMGGVNAAHIAKWSGSSWSPLGSGVGPSFTFPVEAIAVRPNGEVFAAGIFDQSTHGFSAYIGRWNGTQWLPAGAGLDGIPFELITLSNGDVVAAGTFRNAGTLAVNSIARWNGSIWSGFGTGLQHGTYEGPQALSALADGGFIVGGKFSAAGGIPARNIARWNGSQFQPLGAGVDGTVSAIASNTSNEIVAGGRFASAGGVAARNIAKWNGLAWSALGSGSMFGTNAVCFAHNGDVYAGGDFTRPDGSLVRHFGRWNGQFWSDTDVSGTVDAAVTLRDGEIAIGGRFSHTGGRPSGFFSRLNVNSPPEILNQPLSAFACAAAVADFSIDTSDAVLQWEYQLATSADWNNASDGQLVDLDGVPLALLTGANTRVLHIEVRRPFDGHIFCRFRCVAANDCGQTTSNEAALSVCFADINCNLTVDFFDYLDFVAAFTDNAPAANFNGDLIVDMFDYLDFVAAFTEGC